MLIFDAKIHNTFNIITYNAILFLFWYELLTYSVIYVKSVLNNEICYLFVLYITKDVIPLHRNK